MFKALTSRIMENTLAYRLWMAPFADKKMAPILAHNDLRTVRRVLDVGCGPGTNTAHFLHAEYLGLDINPAYIESARRRFNRDFIVADVTKYRVDPAERFDFILLNSLLHHLDETSTRRVLSHLAKLLTNDGHVHIIELVIPRDAPIPRRLAEWDRGDYVRPIGDWRATFCDYFDPVVDEPFAVGMAGMDLWHFVYFKGRLRGS
ncbi:MAG: Methyltransferase type 12 [Geminicoccaceae bacterium]|nr:Methyltransferase type 12 [Geminicoccaceae bacterium]